MTWYILAFVVSTAMLAMTAAVEARIDDVTATEGGALAAGAAATMAVVGAAAGSAMEPVTASAAVTEHAAASAADEAAATVSAAPEDLGPGSDHPEFLRQVGRWVASAPGIEGWAVLDSEGFIVTGELSDELRLGVEALDPAAFARRATRLLHSGWWQRLTLENQSVSLLLQPLPDKYMLLALVKSGYDVEVTWHRLAELQGSLGEPTQ